MSEPRKPIPYGRQNISEEDIEAVVQVLRSDWLTQGPNIDRFEQSVAQLCGVRYAVAVSNATAALHVACLAAGVGRGDTVWTSPNTFVASANCALYCGANPDFVDIDPKTYNLSADLLEAKLKEAAKRGTLPKVIIPVHFSGQSCEMDRIHELAKRYSIRVIEDASHAIGGSYKQLPIGSCRYSDMAVLSFHPVKIVTTGEGGMVLTNDEDLYQKLAMLRTHGITRNPKLMHGKSHGPWYYEQVALGLNYRMTDIQATLGTSQLKRLPQFIERRRALAKRYDRVFAGLPVITPWQSPDGLSAYHLYVIRLRLKELRKSHLQIFEELQKALIQVNLHYIPVHLQPYYERLGFKAGDFPEAERYYGEAISLPMYYGLSDEDQDYVIATLGKVLGA